MPGDADAVPFRWDVSRREQLGRLLRTDPEAVDPSRRMDLWPELLAELRACAARVIGRAGDARLVFVGRSPENLFDYVSGAVADTAWRGRADLLSVSLGDRGPIPPHALRALRAHLRALCLHPAQIASAPLPVALVDLVWQGRTFGNLSEVLAAWAREEGVDVRAVRRRLRFVGITVRSKNSPNTWRWFQRVPWAADYPRAALRGVSVPYWVWTHWGDAQSKTMPSNHVGRWGTDELRAPQHDPETLQALRIAVQIHESARTREERAHFAAALAAREEMREPWLRSLVVAIRRQG